MRDLHRAGGLLSHGRCGRLEISSGAEQRAGERQCLTSARDPRSGIVSFALCDEPSERPTAEALLEKTLELARGIEGGTPSNAVRVGDGWAYTEQKE